MQKVITQLFDLQDVTYRDFHSRLMPTIDKSRVIGIRTPVLRNFAKSFSKDADCLAFLAELPHFYYEENNLHAMLINLVYKDYQQTISAIEQFLPYIDNWATCDTFIPKIFAKNHISVLPKIYEWLKNPRVYTQRFAIVSSLQFFLDEHFDANLLKNIAFLRSDEYYVNMAIAWYLSFALIKQYEATIPIFESQQLEKWVHNKSIQKAIESYRIDADVKQYLRTLRRT